MAIDYARVLTLLQVAQLAANSPKYTSIVSMVGKELDKVAEEAQKAVDEDAKKEASKKASDDAKKAADAKASAKKEGNT